MIVNEFHTVGGELRWPTAPTMCSRSTAALQPLRTAARDAEIAAGGTASRGGCLLLANVALAGGAPRFVVTLGDHNFVRG
ncbi:MAG TPA: hypothetical protein VGJ20_30515 [Xanthobacteraceae bacterium]